MKVSSGQIIVNSGTKQGGSALIGSDACDEIKVSDKDYEAWFEKGIEGGPCKLGNRSNYTVPLEDQVAFDEEIESWIVEGILIQWNEAK